MKKMFILTVCILLPVLTGIGIVQAQYVPLMINYQGYITDAEGTPINGTRSMQFTIYGSTTEGELWTETQDVAIREGYFSVRLGAFTPIMYSVFDGPFTSLEITVGDDSPMTPRKPFSSVAYAHHAHRADCLGSYGYYDFLRSLEGVHPDEDGNIDLVAGSNIVITPNTTEKTITIDALTGGVGGGSDGDITAVYAGTGLTGGGEVGDVTLSVAVPLELDNFSSMQKAGSASIIPGNTAVLVGDCGVHGGYTGGVMFNAYGKLGGSNYGAYAWSEINMYGTRSAYLADGSHGVYGEINVWESPTESYTNYGYLADEDYGAYGEHGPTGNYGYLGGAGYGVYGDTGEEYGILGGTEHGVCGVSLGDDIGVWGISVDGNAIAGAVTGSGLAGIFDGNVQVTGTVTEGSGCYKIDHPLDPANKYLYHSYVESPDMMNVYNGNAVMDGLGEAWVNLPEWFEALNKDFRYQLTCIGEFAQVYIAQEITGNRFKISGGKPGMKVSWQVTGIRRDAFAEMNRIPVEELKPNADRGKYLYPQAFGLPVTHAVGYERISTIEKEMDLITEQREKINEMRVKREADR